MSIEPVQNRTPQPTATLPDDREPLSDQQRAELEDPAIQAQYLEAFHEQLRRRFCPGCGDS